MKLQKDSVSDTDHLDREFPHRQGSRVSENAIDRKNIDANSKRTWPVPQSAQRADAGPRRVMSSMHCGLS